MRRILAIILCPLVPEGAIAQATAPYTLHCTFLNSVQAKDDFSLGKMEFSSKQKLAFSILVDSNNEAYLMGGTGTGKVAMIKNEGAGLTFIELTPAGAAQVTAVDSNFNAVHSRHTFVTQNPAFESNLVPSQWYGKCERR